MISTHIINLIKESNEVLINRLRVEVYAFNQDQTKILAYLRSSSKLPKLPAGGVNINETLIDAAKREMMEESGWTGINFKQIKIPGNWKLNISQKEQLQYFSNWENKSNIQSETNFCVVCEVDQFKPTNAFKTSNDSDNFELYDIDLIYNLTKKSISKNNRIEFHKQFRLTCFNYLKDNYDFF